MNPPERALRKGGSPLGSQLPEQSDALGARPRKISNPPLIPMRKSSTHSSTDPSTGQPRQPSKAPIIPPRSSSKRPFAQVEKDYPSLLSLRDSLKDDITASRKKLRKSVTSMDPPYWRDAKRTSELELQQTETVAELERYKSIRRTGASEDEWDSSPRKKKLDIRARALEHKIVSFGKQAERLDYAALWDEKLATRRAFVSMFMTSKIGKEFNAARASRSNDLQSEFRQSIIEKYNLRPKSEHNSDLLWDVIQGKWVNKSCLTASHLFAYRHGEAAMASIFGMDVRDELFSPKNGLLLSNWIEAEFESGFFAIVPDLPRDASPQERDAWRQSEPKEYRLRFIDKPRPGWVPGKKPGDASKHRFNAAIEQGLRWSMLDGKKLQWRNDYRPRARFLYFVFVLNMLNFAWRYDHKASEIVDEEYEHPFWGSPGPWVKTSMARAFAEQLGQEIEPFLRNTVIDDAQMKYRRGDDELLQEALTSQVCMATRVRGEENFFAEDDDDDDDGDDDDDDDAAADDDADDDEVLMG